MFKVKNKLDEQQYAVKRIRLNPDDEDATQEEIEKEVKVLSKLKHDNVVRYFNSWPEVTSFRPHTGFSDLSESDSDDSSTENTNSYTAETENNDYVQREDKSAGDSTCNEENSFIQFRSDSDSRIKIEKSDETDRIGNSSTYTYKYKYMYIQMELCGTSNLRGLIDNDHFIDVTGMVCAWKMFREMVVGLQYIHSKGIIHRDLKPANIFVGVNNQIKIGDFGLARVVDQVKPNYDLEEISSLKISNRSTKMAYPYLTEDIGTSSYQAPELKTKKYDKRVDIYSLGVIFFELCYPALTKCTVMEKAEVCLDLNFN